ncbi:ABC transporter ATP-binding protein [Williamsia sp. CHRR-6]|uniref:ABC transporter ATP-binding protein n=1 Tax=Williamsia sp. CHRR-6 TaxID=2835871 RepID=UPI001BDB1C5B|nr:ABC transporter ATP-binding protein [Williamsia sp. CHRR-6]MBT0567453.1 ABC transporter ATP-binding protein [Williamsia sp. CHRR-6]
MSHQNPRTATPDAVRLDEVSVSHGRRTVVHAVSLAVRPGAITALLGPSGCGKTTLLRAIAGLHPIDSGSVTIGGEVVANGRRSVPAERRGVGLMPQEGALFPHLDVGANIAFGLPRAGRHARTARVTEVAELAGVAHLLHARPQHLSGGQQQRVALARALAPRPRVVLLDEPFAALDAGLRSSLRDVVTLALRAQRTAAIVVTHDQAEALSIADDIVVLLDGAVAQAGSPQEVYSRPQSGHVAQFVGEGVLLDAVGNGATATCVLGEVAVHGHSAGRGLVVVRPEQVVATADGTGAFAVDRVTFTGPDTMATMRHNDTGVVVRTRMSGSAPAVGGRVGLRVTGSVMFLAD